jgi:hypothetical protein
MWMRDSEGLAAMLFGPCKLETVFKGQIIKIMEDTNYPSEYQIRFTINLEKPARFTLKFRIPDWTTGFSLDKDYRERNKFIEVRKTWKNGDEIILDFMPRIEIKKDLLKESYFTYGPLVLARPIEGIAFTSKEYSLPGFRDLLYTPKSLNVYRIDPRHQVRLTNPKELVFTADLINPKTEKPEPVELVPIGQTILRQVTFK